MIVDSHCHLNYKGLRENIDRVVERARAAHVSTMLTINTKLKEYEEVRALSERYEDVYCSVGVHPHEAENEAGVACEAIIDRTQHPRTVAIGETGLDYYYEHAPKDAQKLNFLAHIRASRETQLPLIVHTRDADADTAEILTQEMERGAFPGVIHCFTASREFADIALNLGFYISFSGIVTFKNAHGLREVAKSMPSEKILVETDAPFLAPVPVRGQTCEPAFVAHTAAFLAELRGENPRDFYASTSDNFFSLFRKAERPGAMTS